MLPLNVTPFQLPDRYCQVDDNCGLLSNESDDLILLENRGCPGRC